jgi:hypothetical protein
LPLRLAAAQPRLHLLDAILVIVFRIVLFFFIIRVIGGGSQQQWGRARGKFGAGAFRQAQKANDKTENNEISGFHGA